MMRSRSLPIIDSSAMISAILSRISSRTFWRWRRRSPAERSERSASEGRYSRKIASTSGIALLSFQALYSALPASGISGLPPLIVFPACRVGRDHTVVSGARAKSPRAMPGMLETPFRDCAPLVLPEIIGCILEHHVDARLAVAVVQQILDHGVVLVGLFLVTGASLGDDARDIAYRGHQLLFDRFLEWFIAALAYLLTPARSRPQVRDHLLTKAFGGRADDRYLLLDRFQEALVRSQLLLGVAVAHLGLVDVGFGMIQVVLE